MTSLLSMLNRWHKICASIPMRTWPCKPRAVLSARLVLTSPSNPTPVHTRPLHVCRPSSLRNLDCTHLKRPAYVTILTPASQLCPKRAFIHQIQKVMCIAFNWQGWSFKPRILTMMRACKKASTYPSTDAGAKACMFGYEQRIEIHPCFMAFCQWTMIHTIYSRHNSMCTHTYTKCIYTQTHIHISTGAQFLCVCVCVCVYVCLCLCVCVNSTKEAVIDHHWHQDKVKECSLTTHVIDSPIPSKLFVEVAWLNI